MISKYDHYIPMYQLFEQLAARGQFTLHFHSQFDRDSALRLIREVCTDVARTLWGVHPTREVIVPSPVVIEVIKHIHVRAVHANPFRLKLSVDKVWKGRADLPHRPHSYLTPDGSRCRDKPWYRKRMSEVVKSEEEMLAGIECSVE